MIRFSFNIGCSESKVIFKRRKKSKHMSNKNALQGANIRTSCISLRTPATNKHSPTQSTHRKVRLEPAIRDAQKLAHNVFPPWKTSPPWGPDSKSNSRGWGRQKRSNAPHMPGVPPLGLNIDRCITPSMFMLQSPPWYMWATSFPGFSLFSIWRPQDPGDEICNRRISLVKARWKILYKNSHFQNERKYKIFPNFICMRKWNIFQTTTFTLSLALTLSLEQLSNCQFSLYLYCYLFPFLFFTCISTCRLTQRL